MFISVRNLHESRGVDEWIARFFVDRPVPQNNAFWEKRLLYITRGNGYLSIPVYYDLLFRIGISREILLDESHIQFMEQVMDYAIQVEFGRISFSEQLNQIESLVKQRERNSEFFFSLSEYLRQPVLYPMKGLGTEVPALNRADVFLFVLCDLPISAEQTERAVRCWYALHTTYLLMDDFVDYREDEKNREENSILELGKGDRGSSKAFGILRQNIGILEEINPVLGRFFENSLAGLRDLNV
jgi:hypothetical protein